MTRVAALLGVLYVETLSCLTHKLRSSLNIRENADDVNILLFVVVAGLGPMRLMGITCLRNHYVPIFRHIEGLEVLLVPRFWHE